MADSSFERALNDRIGDMLDACTVCGKCVESCPSVEPAGIKQAPPAAVIAGVLDLVRTGEGPDAPRQCGAIVHAQRRVRQSLQLWR